MSIDRYTKVVLTVIAVCLVWIATGGPSLMPAASAQILPQRVIVIGWEDGNGKQWALPNMLIGPGTSQKPTRPVQGFPTTN
jgi:hypothetical protein